MTKPSYRKDADAKQCTCGHQDRARLAKPEHIKIDHDHLVRVATRVYNAKGTDKLTATERRDMIITVTTVRGLAIGDKEHDVTLAGLYLAAMQAANNAEAKKDTKRSARDIENAAKEAMKIATRDAWRKS